MCYVSVWVNYVWYVCVLQMSIRNYVSEVVIVLIVNGVWVDGVWFMIMVLSSSIVLIYVYGLSSEIVVVVSSVCDCMGLLVMCELFICLGFCLMIVECSVSRLQLVRYVILVYSVVVIMVVWCDSNVDSLCVLSMISNVLLFVQMRVMESR